VRKLRIYGKCWLYDNEHGFDYVGDGIGEGKLPAKDICVDVMTNKRTKLESGDQIIIKLTFIEGQPSQEDLRFKSRLYKEKYVEN